MEEAPKLLPINCLDCPNHRHTKAWAGREPLIGKVDVRCQLEQGKVVAIAQSKNAGVAPPDWCPLKDEKQPWENDALILGCIQIEIEGVGEIKSTTCYGAPGLALIDRAIWALSFLTGVPVRENAPLEFVSADPRARKAVFHQKGTA